MIDEKEIEKHDADCRDAKVNFPDGPWQVEPNRVNWKHEDMDCMIVRHPSSGHLCGYVGVTPSHPDFAKSYNDVDVDVHGGLTYSDHCFGHICHVQAEGEDKTYWFGFDCAHAGDVSPSMRSYLKNNDGHDSYHDSYKDISYVKAETERLAKQLAARKAA